MGRRKNGLYLFYIALAVVAILFFLRRVEGFSNESDIELTYSDNTTPIKVFLYADKIKPTAKALMKSLQKHKYSYEVLGMGKPWEGWVARAKEYVSAAQRYKAENGGDAIMMFVDAYDVICVKDSDKLYKSYMEHDRDMPVIFGAEKNCHTEMCNKEILDWYDYNEIEGGKAAVEAQMNKWGNNNEHLWSRERPAFTNNGTIMGTADGLEFLFTEIIKTGIPDDQVAGGHVVVANFDKFDIDFEEKFFRNRFRELDKLPDEGSDSGPGFLHFHAMKTDEQQAEVLRRFQSYM
jgi:hypothetical protein